MNKEVLTDALKHVTNENTRLALTHRCLGVDISLAKKHLLLAANEDDLAKFLILYSTESGGGFGFEEEELDPQMLGYLIRKKHLPTILYYTNIKEEETNVPPFILYMCDVKCGHKRYVPWLAEFGDARCQTKLAYDFRKSKSFEDAHPWDKKAAKQKNSDGLYYTREYYYHIRGNLHKVLNYTINAKNINMYEKIGSTKDKCVMYRAGKLFKGNINTMAGWDPRPHVQFYDRVKSNCQYMTLYWIWIAKQYKMAKDVYLIIADDIWESRLSKPGVWNFQSSCTIVEQSSWIQSVLVKLAMYLNRFASDVKIDE